MTKTLTFNTNKMNTLNFIDQCIEKIKNKKELIQRIIVYVLGYFIFFLLENGSIIFQNDIVFNVDSMIDYFRNYFFIQCDGNLPKDGKNHNQPITIMQLHKKYFFSPANTPEELMEILRKEEGLTERAIARYMV